MPRMNVVRLLPSCALLLAACATSSKVDPVGPGLAAKREDCEIAFFKDTKPAAPFEIVGKIETHIAKNLFFGGRALLERDGYAELRKKACALGGDAVIVDDRLESRAAEVTHLHIWATVARSVPAPPQGATR